MQDTVAVAVGEGLDDLENDVFDRDGVERVPQVQELFQVVLHDLENQVELLLLQDVLDFVQSK